MYFYMYIFMHNELFTSKTLTVHVTTRQVNHDNNCQRKETPLRGWPTQCGILQMQHCWDSHMKKG